MSKRLLAFFCTSLLVGAVAVPAIAQTPAAPVATGSMDVQIWPGAQQGSTVVIASVTLDPDTPLPATVRIPIVPGTTVDWAGEIAGTVPEDDPVREYTVVDGEGGQYAELVLSEFRQAQIESVGLPLVVSGDSSSVEASWVQSAPATETILSVRLLPGARDVEITPAPAGPPAQNQQGESLYTLPVQTYADGQTVDISVAYQTGTQFEGGLQGGESASTVIGILLAALAVAIVGLMWALSRQRRGATVDESPGDEDAVVDAPEDDDSWLAESNEPFSDKD